MHFHIWMEEQLINICACPSGCRNANHTLTEPAGGAQCRKFLTANKVLNLLRETKCSLLDLASVPRTARKNTAIIPNGVMICN